jgi:phage terminase large subunit-like protein
MSVDIQNNTINGVHSWLLEYYNKTKSGDIIIGRDVQKQLNLLIKDLSNTAYIYDMRNAHDRIDFIESCIKLTKSPFYGMPMICMLWQKCLIEALYSFKWTEDGYYRYYKEYPNKTHLNRFKKLHLLIGRKNTKSETTSALGLTEFFLGEAGNDIVCSSNNDEQSKLVFDAMNVMREMIDPKNKRSKKTLSIILNSKTNTKIFRLSDRTKNKEGRNIGLGILDESNEMAENIIAKSVEQSQSIKDEPLFINISTEGFIDNGYLSNELKYARQILNEEEEDATLLSFLYCQDSEQEVWQGLDNPRIWEKANPSLGQVKKVSYLRDQIKKAQIDSSERAMMMVKDFNLHLSSAQSWLNQSDYENKLTYKLKDLWGHHAIGCVDLSESVDLTSAKLIVFKPGDNKKYIVSHYWIPEAKLDANGKADGVDYRQWEKDGLLTICSGTDVDTQLVVDWFLKMNNDHEILPYVIAIDSWGSKLLKKQLEDIGFKVEKIEQGFRLSSAMKMTEQEFKKGNINYNDNEIDKWCLSNTSIELNNYGQIRPIKSKGNKDSSKRIDGSVSLIIGFSCYQLFRTEFHNYFG